MTALVRVRLQAGPFDGTRRTIRATSPPEALWVEGCEDCRQPHCFLRATARGELYRRDEQRGQLWLYVWTDPQLGDDTGVVGERELVGASTTTGGEGTA